MKSLLIVEDEKLIRQGIVTMAKRAPVEIEEILEGKNGEEALQILRSRPVEVMFTDIRMPKMDGITLIQKLAELPDPPRTVVISGYDDFNYAVEALRGGCPRLYFEAGRARKGLRIVENTRSGAGTGAEAAPAGQRAA